MLSLCFFENKRRLKLADKVDVIFFFLYLYAAIMSVCMYLCIISTHFICPSCVEPSPYAIASAVLLTLFISGMTLFTVNTWIKFRIWYMIVLLKCFCICQSFFISIKGCSCMKPYKFSGVFFAEIQWETILKWKGAQLGEMWYCFAF